MFQNFIDDHIRKLAPFDSSGSAISLTGAPAFAVNAGRYYSPSAGGFSVVLDSLSDCIVSYHLIANEAGDFDSDATLMIGTYITDNTGPVSWSSSLTPCAFGETFIRQGQTMEWKGRVVVPKLSPSDGQVQVLSFVARGGSGSLFADVRAHVDEVQSFQPMKC